MSTILRSEKFINPQYLTCLRSYWNGQLDKCKKQIIRGISSSAYPDTDIYLYRLWIEISAKERDLSSLEVLKSHLNQLADEDHEFQNLYYSLIAIIHFELDEIEAAELMLSSLEQSKSNLYTRELQFWLDARKSEHILAHDWLLKYGSVDYVAVEKVARYFAQLSDYSNSLSVCRYASDYYEESCLEEKIQLQLIIELESWNDAEEVSGFLHKKFSHNPDFLFQLAYAKFRNKRITQAIDNLEQAAELSHHQDPHILHLLGHAYVERFKKSQSKGHYNKAIKVLELGIKVAQEMGLPIDYPSNQKVRLMKMQGKETEITGNFWLAKVSAQSFAQIRTKDQSDLKFMRKPLGGQAGPGDLCFIVCEDTVSKDKTKVWRLGALYRVIEEAEWDPIHRSQNLMELEYLPEIAVTLDMHEESRKAGAIHNPEDPRRFDVYQLDDSGFDMIIENICETLGGEDQISKTLSKLRSA